MSRKDRPTPSPYTRAMPHKWKNKLQFLHCYISSLQANAFIPILYLNLFELNVSMYGYTIWGLFHMGKGTVRECIPKKTWFFFVQIFFYCFVVQITLNKLYSMGSWRTGATRQEQHLSFVFILFFSKSLHSILFCICFRCTDDCQTGGRLGG